MRRAIPVTLALTLASALSLSACESMKQTADQSASTSSTSSASASASSAPSASVAMTAGFKVSDVQEAEKVYRQFYSAFLDVQRAGGATRLPSSLSQYLDKPAVSLIAASLKADHDQGVRLVSKGEGSLDVRPAEGYTEGDSVVALRSCADGRSLIYSGKDGATGKGKITLNYLYFHRNATHRLVIFETKAKRDASSCSH